MINKKIYLILLPILLIIILFFLFFSIRKTKLPTTVVPSPTSIYPTKFVVAPSPTPTLIPPASFTGVLEETLPPATLDLSNQRRELRKKTPLVETYFTVTFDYGEDKFLVALKEPKDQSKIEFEKWRIVNYQAIPPDHFIIK